MRPLRVEEPAPGSWRVVYVNPPINLLNRAAGRTGRASRALEIIASSNDYDGPTAERSGWVNRALPDGELDGFVDALARRVAGFEAGAIATVKRLVGRQSPAAGLEDNRETLQALRTQLTSPASAARREKVQERALMAGADFEFRLGHHLGPILSDLGRQDGQ